MTDQGLPPSEQVMQMLRGFMISQVTALLARLGIPDLLVDAPRSAVELARETEVDAEALARVLRAAADLGLVTAEGPNMFGLTPLGDALRADSPVSVRDRALSLVSRSFWDSWREFENSVRTGKPSAHDVLGGSQWEYFANHPTEGADFSRMMGRMSAARADDVAAVIDLGDHRTVVDVGGAYGVLLRRLLWKASSETRAVLFDQPAVVSAAAEELAEFELVDRISFVGGDFFEAVPSGGLYLLEHIIHDWDDTDAGRILTSCRRASEPGAQLLLVEMIRPDPWVPSPVHLLDLQMLVMYGGRERTLAEYRELLDATGWELRAVLATAGPYSVLKAVQPSA